MSAEIIRKFNDMFNNGIVPDEFNYHEQSQQQEIDWSKVAYNTFYKTPEYFLSKFPPGFENLPGADKIIDEMIIQAKSPLEEIQERQQEAINKIWEASIENIECINIDNEQEGVAVQCSEK
jgi:hypothetical protein